VPVRVVFFDLGETLFDETRPWGAWADWLGVPRLTFFGVLGGVIERGEHHRRVFEIVRPGLDQARERAARVAAGADAWFDRRDLYPDAVPCLQALRAEGYRVGLAGNQTTEEEFTVGGLGLPSDLVTSAAACGFEKPAPGFFAHLVDVAGVPAGEIAYVGDRLDNDVLPALAAGVVAVFLRRGPWGHLHADRPETARAHLRLDSLADLPAALRNLDRTGRRIEQERPS